MNKKIDARRPQIQKMGQAGKVEQSLSAELKEQLRHEEELAIAEVAGRDSAAAIIKAASFDSISAILPTLVYAGTEYGSWATVFDNVNAIKDYVEQDHKKQFYDVVPLSDAKLWWALNGRFITVLFDKFGFYSPCLGCHLYMHLVRVPLAKELGCTKIISGERVKHDKRIKLNQTAVALDAYRKILGYAGIELIFPVREIASGHEINSLVGGDWEEGEKQLRCVLSGNYQSLSGKVVFDPDKVRSYVCEFIVPVGKKILEAWDKKSDVDYVEIVRSVLART